MKAEEAKQIRDALENLHRIAKSVGRLQERADMAEARAAEQMKTIADIVRANTDKEGGEGK